MERYKKILIIGAEVQPIPPVEGGAVEILINHLIEENEIQKFAELTIASPFTSEALRAAAKYRNTSFKYISNNDSLLAKIINFADLFSRRFFDHILGNSYIHSLCSQVDFNSFDLVIVENRPMFGKIIRKKYQGKLMLHLHNDFINRSSRHNRETIPYFDGFIVVSTYLKKRLSEVTDKDITIVYNGVDLDRFLLTGASVKQQNIIYVGRLVEEKGVLELIEAFKSLPLSFSLTIVGGYDHGAENEKQFIEKFEKAVSSDDRIKVAGYIDNNEIHKYYDNALIGVVPSIVNEAFGLSALEMMASGLPVIVSDAGGLPEVVDEECGIIVKRDELTLGLKKALDELIRDEDKIKKMAVAAKKKATMFSKRAYIDSMKRYFDAF